MITSQSEMLEVVREAVSALLDRASRINEAQERRYWYPLSLATYGVEEIAEALDSMCAFRTSMWEKTSHFERSLAEFLGSGETVMVNSGSSADRLACLAIRGANAGPASDRNEVLVPVVTWPTHVWAPLMAGFTVKLVDVDPETLNMSMEDLREHITDRTCAIFPVHLMGNPCNMDELSSLCQQHDLLLLEDCCEALGSRWRGQNVGGFGAAGTFSFFFSHHITTMEGGAIWIRDQDLADDLRVLRAHGWLRNTAKKRRPVSDGLDRRYTFVNWGGNFRPTELQAGFGIRQLEKAPQFAERRATLAKRFFTYIASLEYFTTPKVHDAAEPSWFALPLMISENAPFTKGEITSFLEALGVENRPIVAGNLARQPVAELFPAVFDRTYFGADAVHKNGFYLGLNPFVTDEMMERLIQLIDRFVRER